MFAADILGLILQDWDWVGVHMSAFFLHIVPCRCAKTATGSCLLPYVQAGLFGSAASTQRDPKLLMCGNAIVVGEL